MSNLFFLKNGPFTVDNLLQLADIDNVDNLSQSLILDIKDLKSASENDITFYHSKKYQELAESTNASFCITNDNLKNHLPDKCKKIIVKNVLVSTAVITKIFYPDSVNDDFDKTVKDISKTDYRDKVEYGYNVLIGEGVQIGKNCKIGHNSILESNVIVGDNCSLGSNVIIRKSIIHSNVNILDGCIIGKKGFGFFHQKNKNIRYPHIGIVIIEDYCEIGSGSTIDRGSLSNTIIGKNTYIDNQVHVAHNNKIGSNCIVAGQVGFAGSSIIGNNVIIGGQAGISGHLRIGDNVQIGGGSGVIRNVKNNAKIMGYPAKNLKVFLKNNK